MGQVNWLSAFGLVLDIVGAIWLAIAYAAASDRQIMKQAAPPAFANVTLRNLERQRIDARCGLAILISGFFMQLVGLFLPHVPHWIAGLTAALVVSAAFFYYRQASRRDEATRGDRIAKHILHGGDVPD